MEKMRLLKADEIEVRVAQMRDTSATFLLYINSRAAGALLDETYGAENWLLEYKDVAGQIYGRLSIWDEEHNRYVYREDTGSESNIEAEKGMASDILKRLVVRFGVSELYSAPEIKVDLKSFEVYEKNGKPVCTAKLNVSRIEYNENREITFLEIVDKWGNVRFTTNGSQQPSKPAYTAQNTAFSIDDLKRFCRAQTDAGNDCEVTKKFYLFYESKLASWTGKFDAAKLYERWLKNNPPIS